MLDKFVYDSGVDGCNLLLLGCIHGNEISGSIEIFKLKEKLDNGEITLLSGRLTLMPICNPLAYEAKTRFVEKNLNRIIGLKKQVNDKEEVFANEVEIGRAHV